MITSPLVGIILFMAGAMSLLWTLLVVDIDFDLNPNIRITSLPSQVAARFALRLIFALTTFPSVHPVRIRPRRFAGVGGDMDVCLRAAATNFGTND
jgi:hypothetical protein